jgi:U3 small nucleolar RNA-associated protein MPP10
LLADRRKRKRGADSGVAQQVLRLKQLHIDGFSVDQVWEQARRILDASRQEVERSLAQRAQLDRENPETGGARQGDVKAVRFAQDGSEIGELGSEDEAEEAVVEHEIEESDGEDASNSGLAEADLGEDPENAADGLEEGGEDIEVDDTDLDSENDVDEQEATVLVPDKHGLNDGFFSIDDFNKTSEFLEQQDTMGDPNHGAASDEDDIDWDADPMLLPMATKKIRSDHDASDSDEDGPTFGNADLNASFSDSEAEAGSTESLPMEDLDMANTNDIKYADFFVPPARPANKPSRRRPLPKTQPPPSDTDIQRTISAVRRDIFDDELSDPDEPDPANPNAGPLSTHEKRQAALRTQILALEAASVAARAWTLSGEARAAQRPLNSLLEEDLEFERVGKPVPVITAAVSEDIEALIKRRILARDFDEVIKRRPGAGALTVPEARRGRVELDDVKSKVGLAELYADDHLRATDPAYVDTRDAALRERHAAIERMWADVSAKLDALSSWHYRPKPAEVNVRAVEDVARVAMEDARPSGVVGVGDDAGRLAPQEVFRVGGESGQPADGRAGADGARLLVGGAAGVVSTAEMTREEKLRRRRRAKERARKRGGDAAGIADSRARAGGEEKTGGKEKAGGAKAGRRAGEQKRVLDELKKGGVRVIGRRGEVTDVDGKVAKVKGSGGGAGRLKL